MFLPERRRPSLAEPEAPAADDDDSLSELAALDEEPDAWDEADELAAMPDADFLRQLRAEVEGVRAGIVPAGRESEHPAPKDRPWSPKRKRRDRYGRAFGDANKS